jgi:hypothetical protein
MRRRVVGVVYIALAVVFAFSGAYLLSFLIGGGPILGYALAAVFALGSVVCVRSAREAFGGSESRGARSA